jgi:hypothetical protein
MVLLVAAMPHSVLTKAGAELRLNDYEGELGLGAR